jgi:hypothetical protein
MFASLALGANCLKGIWVLLDYCSFESSSKYTLICEGPILGKFRPSP